jgi:DNA-binding CsgD family transcriptional regulator
MKPSTIQIIGIGASIGLSPRESAIAALVHSEESDKRISLKLGGSTHTVRSHLRRIFDKCQVYGRIGLALQWERASAVAGICYAGNGDMQEKRKRLK